MPGSRGSGRGLLGGHPLLAELLHFSNRRAASLPSFRTSSSMSISSAKLSPAAAVSTIGGFSKSLCSSSEEFPCGPPAVQPGGTGRGTFFSRIAATSTSCTRASSSGSSRRMRLQHAPTPPEDPLAEGEREDGLGGGLPDNDDGVEICSGVFSAELPVTPLALTRLPGFSACSVFARLSQRCLTCRKRRRENLNPLTN